jgi:hypothetical protein
MARVPRIALSDHPHHVTQRGVRSMAIFSDDEDRMDYLNFVADETARFGVEILECSGDIITFSNRLKFHCVPGIPLLVIWEN